MKLNNSLDGSRDCFSNSIDNNLDCINEKCFECQKHFINIKNIRLGVLDDQYYCVSCSEELHIKTTECRDI
jgi:predicted SprT family Zn-dependent metalloprotease